MCDRMNMKSNINKIEYIGLFSTGHVSNTDNLIVTYDDVMINNICDKVLGILSSGNIKCPYVIDGPSILISPKTNPTRAKSWLLVDGNNVDENDYTVDKECPDGIDGLRFDNSDDLSDLLGGKDYDLLKMDDLILYNNPTNFIESVKYENVTVTSDPEFRISAIYFHHIKYSVDIDDKRDGRMKRVRGRQNYRPIDKDTSPLKHLEVLDHTRMDDGIECKRINGINCIMELECQIDYLDDIGGVIRTNLFILKIDLGNYINSTVINININDDTKLDIKSIIRNLLFDALESLTPSKPPVNIVEEALDGSEYNMSTNPCKSISFPTALHLPMQGIASQLVPTPPMSAPTGLLGYIDYEYGLSDKDKLELLQRFKLELLYDE